MYVFPLPIGAAHVYESQAVAVTFVITGTHTADGFNLNGDAPAGLGVIIADNPVVELMADETPGGVIKHVATQAVLPANAFTCIGVKVLHCVNGLKFTGKDVADVCTCTVAKRIGTPATKGAPLPEAFVVVKRRWYEPAQTPVVIEVDVTPATGPPLASILGSRLINV